MTQEIILSHIVTFASNNTQQSITRFRDNLGFPLFLWNKYNGVLLCHSNILIVNVRFVRYIDQLRHLQKTMMSQPTIVKLFHQLTPEHIDFKALSSFELLYDPQSMEPIKEDVMKWEDIVENIAKNAESPKDLLKKLLPFITDCLFLKLKGGLFSIYNQIKLSSKNLDKVGLYETLKNMSFPDFIILLLKMMNQKDVLGILLSSIKIPFPIYFQVGNKPIKMTELLKGILSKDNLSLVLNCSSEKAKIFDKTTFLFDLFSLPKDYLYNESQFYSSSVYAHKILNTIIADLNESLENISQKISFLQKNCALIIIHILQQELCNQEGGYIGDQYFQKYQKLLEYPEKVVLLIRNSKNLKLETVMDSLGNLKKKCSVFCVKQQSQYQTYSEITEEIQKNSLFDLKKTFNYFDILQDQKNTQDIQKYYEETKQMIKELPSDEKLQKQENAIQQLFPYYTSTNQVNTLNEKLIEKKLQYKLIHEKNEKEKELQKIKGIEQKIALNEKRQQSDLETNSFLKKGFEILTKGIKKNQYIEVAQTMLFLWKKEKIKPLILEYIRINKDIKNMLATEASRKLLFIKEAEKIEEKIEIYDILSPHSVVDAIITKLSSKNKVSQQTVRSINEVLVERFYNNSYGSRLPLKLIHENSLIFGNKYLKQFFRNLSSNLNKKVYTISVLGMQSSGKSTLLNYLFRAQFETSPIKCTKGVYFTICQFEDKIIWVIDTQGLLASLDARSSVLDNKIVTFVLSISDVVIFTNKGEFTSQLKEMLKICTFAKKQLIKEGKIVPNKSQKLIFGLQYEKIPNDGKKIVSKIMDQFEQSKLNEQLNILPSDFYLLSKAFDESQTRISSSEILENQKFGQCISGLRLKILNILRNNEGRRSIFDCYEEASSTWEIISKNCSNLLDYKKLAELEIEKKVEEKFNEMQQKWMQDLDKQFNPLIQSLEENPEDWEKTYNQKEKKLSKGKLKLINQFQKQLNEKIASGGVLSRWLDVKHKRIQSLCQDYENLYLNMFSQKKGLEDSFKVKLKRLNDQRQWKAENIFKLFEDTRQSAEMNQQKQTKHLERFSLSLELTLASLFQRGFKDQKFSRSGFQWIASFKNMSSLKNYEELYKWKDNKNSEAQEKIMEDIFTKIVEKISQKVQKAEDLKNLTQDIIGKAKQLDSELKNLLQQAKSELNQINNMQGLSLELHSYQNIKIREVLRGCLLSKIFERQSKNQIDDQIQRKKDLLNLISEEKRKLKQVVLPATEFIIKQYLKKLGEFYQSEFKKSCHEKVKQHIDKITNSLNPKRIVLQNFEQSYLAKHSGKNKWIQCFKGILNPSKYSFEVMCRDPIIAFRKQYSLKILAEEKNKLKKKLMQKHQEMLKMIQKNNQAAFQKYTAQIKQMIHQLKNSFDKVTPQIYESRFYSKIQPFLQLFSSIIDPIAQKFLKDFQQKVQRNKISLVVFDKIEAEIKNLISKRDFKNFFEKIQEITQMLLSNRIDELPFEKFLVQFKNQGYQTNILFSVLKNELNKSMQLNQSPEKKEEKLNKPKEWIEWTLNCITIDEINKEIQKHIKQDIRIKVVGCNRFCPFCKTKCTRSANHKDKLEDGFQREINHHIQSNYFPLHGIQAFGGRNHAINNNGIRSVCCSSTNFIQKYNYSGLADLTKVGYIQRLAPDWLHYFKYKSEGSYQSQMNKEKLLEVWVNIQKMIIRYSKPDIDEYVESEDSQKRKDPLTEKDIEQGKYQNLEGILCPLRDYLDFNSLM